MPIETLERLSGIRHDVPAAYLGDTSTALQAFDGYIEILLDGIDSNNRLLKTAAWTAMGATILVGAAYMGLEDAQYRRQMNGR